jgi:large conductance mechanosensitive channel
MIKGFRDFILRGNVIDLAVAVVIGGAFTALVKAFTDAFITPLVNTALWALGMGKDGVPGSITLPSGEVLGFGVMITAIIIFLITAAVIYFVFVVPMNKYRERFVEEEVAEAEISSEQLLTEIRDLLKEQKSS